jgi:nucleoside-diphosphate-sugar epimerase
MKIVVTGGSGFLGSWICRILENTSEVHSFVRNSSSLYNLNGLTNTQVSRVSDQELQKTLQDLSPDVVIDSAWSGVGNQFRNNSSQGENIERGLMLASAAKHAGVKLFLGVGSQAELGPVANQILETQMDAPTTHYGQAKVDMRTRYEELFRNSNTAFVWMRIFSTYGPLDTGNWLIPNLVDGISKGNLTDLTLGEQQWSYLHAVDLANAFKCVIDAQLTRGIVNVGNPETLSIRDVATFIAQTMGRIELLNFGAIPYRSDQVMILKPECETLKSIGWAPQINIFDGLSQTIDWLQGQQVKATIVLGGSTIKLNLPIRI